ncbi:MAG: hypothetical protein ACLP8X_07220 [Streptosporangiaceae bacterium]
MNRDKAEELFRERGYMVRHGLFDAVELEVLKGEIPLLVDAHRETLGLPYRMRSRITAAIRVWSHDERRAVELFRAALADEDAARNDQRIESDDFG